MIKRGVYAASLSVLNENYALDIDATIQHAENLIKKGLHGVFFFGSTGQSQLISIQEKKELISKLSTHKLKRQFFFRNRKQFTERKCRFNKVRNGVRVPYFFNYASRIL